MKFSFISLLLISLPMTSFSQQKPNPQVEVFGELMNYVRSCPSLETYRQYRSTAKVEADLADRSTTHSFLPRARIGIDEREGSDQLDQVQVVRLSGSVSLAEIMYGYKVSDLQAKAETLNADIKIYDGVSSIVEGFFKWRALSMLQNQLESINEYFTKIRKSNKKKLSYSELGQRTDALLISSRLSGYQSQILFFEKLFANCSKKMNLKNPWDIDVPYNSLPPTEWSQSIEEQAKRRGSVELSHCQAKSNLRGMRMAKEKATWYPKMYYGWSRETGSKVYPDRSSWNVGLEISIPLPGEPTASIPTDECHIRLQQESIVQADQTELAKQHVQQLIELTSLRDRWGEIMKDSLAAFRIEENGSIKLASAISQFERLNLQVAELEASLAMSTFGVPK